MSNFEVGLIIALVIGVIVSNLAVLKYSARFKLPQFGQQDPNKKAKEMHEANKEKAQQQSSSEKESDKTDASE